MNCFECKERLWPENPEIAQYDPRTKKRLPPLCQGCANAYQKKEADLRGRVSNLEAISAEPGRIPRAYYDRFKQMQGEIAYLRNRLDEALGKKRQPTKSGYKGLVADGR